MPSLTRQKITPKMDFGLVSAINKTLNTNVFVAKKPVNNENKLFNKSKVAPKNNKRNLKKK